jgi:hypothetical protein
LFYDVQERRSKMMSNPTDGPYIQAACFCEQVIEGKDGVLSLIRVIDTLNHGVAGAPPPDEMPPFGYALKVVLMLKSGAARGRHNIRIEPELPNGSTQEAMNMTVHLEGEEKGQNIIANMNFVFTLEGLYWFNVFLDDTKLTAIPLRVKYDRVVIGPNAPRAA